MQDWISREWGWETENDGQYLTLALKSNACGIAINDTLRYVDLRFVVSSQLRTWKIVQQ